MAAGEWNTCSLHVSLSAADVNLIPANRHKSIWMWTWWERTVQLQQADTWAPHAEEKLSSMLNLISAPLLSRPPEPPPVYNLGSRSKLSVSSSRDGVRDNRCCVWSRWTYLELSVALCVLQHVQQELCALLGPASLSPAELFGLKTTSTVSMFLQPPVCSSPVCNAAQIQSLVSSFIQRCPKWSSQQLHTLQPLQGSELTWAHLPTPPL